MPPANKAPAKKAVAKKAVSNRALPAEARSKARAKRASAQSTMRTQPSVASDKNVTKSGVAAKKASSPAPNKTTAPTKPPSQKAVSVPKKEAPTKPAAAKKPVFDAKFLEAQRLLLLEERATYTKQAENLQAEADSLAELREPGDVQFDEESGEGDTLAVERERDLALSARARHEVEEIDRALVKIEEGTYGICEVSGQAIPRARLQAIPQARERVEYKVGGFNRR
jgi:RNA polymerase-binding transcription factor DksA